MPESLRTRQAESEYVVIGLTQSYFTRKMTAYLAYKRIPHRMIFMTTARQEACGAEGWPRGIPPVRTPDGTLMWDSTPMIHYLDGLYPDREVLHPDPTQRFLGYAIEDFMDEWATRFAVATRWYIEENAVHNRWAIGRELSHGTPASWEQAGAFAEAYVTGLCPVLGVVPDNAHLWTEELRSWMRRIDALLAERAYLFGDRPSLADFAVAGPCIAHFHGDPACRRMMEEDAPALRAYTERLLEPDEQRFGGWCAADDVPDALIGLLEEIGRVYLPWVAAVGQQGGRANIRLGDNAVELGALPYTLEARETMLARYRAAKCDALDSLLERAGILRHFDNYTSRLAAPPTYTSPPRGELN